MISAKRKQVQKIVHAISKGPKMVKGTYKGFCSYENRGMDIVVFADM